MVALTDKFAPSDLEWKPQTTGIKNGKPWAMVLCYVTARAIQDRLDAVYGPLGWKDSYRFEPHGTMCSLSVKDKTAWVTKENGSQETDIESFKGGISSAFKRVAASGFGIGRYLYKLDTVFATCTLEKQYGKDWNHAKHTDKKTKAVTYFYWQTPSIGSKPPKPPVVDDKVVLEKELYTLINSPAEFDDIKNDIGMADIKLSTDMTSDQLKKMIAEAKKRKEVK